VTISMADPKEEDSEATARLDENYRREDSRLDATLRRAQRQSIDRKADHPAQ
jgi:hypothetical protein